MPLCSYPASSYLLSLLVLRINDGLSHIRRLFWLDSSREIMAIVTSSNYSNTGYYNRNIFISNLSPPVKKQEHLWGNFYRRDIICCVQVLNVLLLRDCGRDSELQSQRMVQGWLQTDTDLGICIWLWVCKLIYACLWHRQGVPTAWLPAQGRWSEVVLPSGEMFGNGYKLRWCISLVQQYFKEFSNLFVHQYHEIPCMQTVILNIAKQQNVIQILQIFQKCSHQIYPGNSLVVQWLRIYLAMWGMWVQSLGVELRSHELQSE